MDSTLKNTLPDDILLSIHYYDHKQDFETWRVYCLDGRLRIFDGHAWRLEKQFDDDDIQKIRQILRDCGLKEGEDLLPQKGTHDTARYRWRWRDDSGHVHEVVNHAYPAEKHPAMECAMDKLLDLEGFEA